MTQCHADMVTTWSSDTITCETFLQSFVVVLTCVPVEVGRDHLGFNSNSHPADVLVDGWERAKPAAFDVTVTSPLTPATLSDVWRSAGVAVYTAQSVGSTLPLTESVRSWGRSVFLLLLSHH